MYAVLGTRSVTEDVLLRTIRLVEQTLNARPLTQLNFDATDLEAITPNNFNLTSTTTFVYTLYQVQINDYIFQDRLKLLSTNEN